MSEDYLARQPMATWNTARGVWETDRGSLLCEHLEPFSEVWPTSGIMKSNGQVFELQTPVHRMDDSEFSSSPRRSIPTPTVSDYKWDGSHQRSCTIESPYRGLSLGTWSQRAAEGNLDMELLRTLVASEAEGGAMHPDDVKAGNHSLKLGWQILGHFDHIKPRADRDLPTPTTRDYKDGAIEPAAHRPEDKDTLVRALAHLEKENLLPTPNTMEHREIKSKEKIAELKERSPGGYRNLREEVVNEAQNWGQYEPAIRRWEGVMGRPAPSPTEPTGKDGSHRLSAKFTEWMMGVPEGHITSDEIGLSRADALKACGNGVVPQQALLALQYLLREES